MFIEYKIKGSLALTFTIFHFNAYFRMHDANAHHSCADVNSIRNVICRTCAYTLTDPSCIFALLMAKK